MMTGGREQSISSQFYDQRSKATVKKHRSSTFPSSTSFLQHEIANSNLFELNEGRYVMRFLFYCLTYVYWCMIWWWAFSGCWPKWAVFLGKWSFSSCGVVRLFSLHYYNALKIGVVAIHHFYLRCMFQELKIIVYDST